MNRFGLIGRNISHSKSPELFKKYFSGKECSYQLIDCENFDEGLQFALENGIYAFNVTMPYKEDAFMRSNIHDPVSGILECTNLLVISGDNITSYNTDYYGVKRCLEAISPETKKILQKKALVIGCGGAGKAAALAARDCGFETTVTNRNFQKAEYFSRKAGIKALSIEEATESQAEFGLVILTAPCIPDAMSGGKFDFSEKAVLEANYKNPVLSEKKCGLYISGLAWLVNQAIPSFEIFKENF